ncbi:hypothetical protein, partial [Streptosporangium sp. NPDC003464]
MAEMGVGVSNFCMVGSVHSVFLMSETLRCLHGSCNGNVADNQHQCRWKPQNRCDSCEHNATENALLVALN